MKKIPALLFLFHFGFHTHASLRTPTISAPSENGKELNFTENKGQISDQFYHPRPDVLFSGTDGDLVFHLKNNGISYQLNRASDWKTLNTSLRTHVVGQNTQIKVPGKTSIYRVDVNWLNANTNCQIVKENEVAGYNHYYLESCPNGALFVKSYKKITYKNLYPGIDLIWYENNGHLKYDYLIAAHTNPGQIQFEFSGAQSLSTGKDGELIIKTPFGKLIEQKPLVFQNNKQLEAHWVIQNNRVSIDIRNVDSSLPLTIDPIVRSWGTYYGGSNVDDVEGVSVDNVGNSYLFGETRSNNGTLIATSGAHQFTYGGGGSYWGDAFVAKFNSSGVRQWATYYGGAQDDFANWCTTDAGGNVFMVGGTSTTNSAVMATAGTHQSTPPVFTGTLSGPGTKDAFLAKFNSSGIRQWGTYYGGSNFEWAYYASVNSSGNILVSGATASTDGTSIATAGCYQATFGGGTADVFLVEFNSTGQRNWGTYYGGPGSLSDDGIWNTYDSNGDIYLTGLTNSTANIASPGAHQTSPGGASDGFISKFNASGQLLWGTYYGGTGTDYFYGGCLDASGNVYASGITSTTLTGIIATPGAHQQVYGGSNDAMVVKFNSSGTRLWGTYYGGAGHDLAGRPAVDVNGDLYFSGMTASSSGTVIATACAYQSNYGGGTYDAYLTKFSPAGTRLWGTYYGGPASDYGLVCAVDLNGNIFMSGSTSTSTGTIIASSGAHQALYGGGSNDGFLVKFAGCYPIRPDNLTPLGNLRICSGHTTTLNTSCGNWYRDSTGNSYLGSGSSFTLPVLTRDTTFYIEETSCGFSIGRTPVHVSVTPLPTVSIVGTNTLGCIGEQCTLTATGASSYTWNNSTSSSTIQLMLFLVTSYSVVGVDVNGCTNSSSVVLNPNLCLGVTNQLPPNGEISVYPNPNSGHFSITSSYATNLMLVDSWGRKIKDIPLHSANNFSFEVNDLAEGIYFLRDQDDKNTFSQKIIVLH